MPVESFRILFRSSPIRLVLALVVIALCYYVRVWFLGILDNAAPYITFYPSVMIAALLGGLGVGLLATALGALFSTTWMSGGFANFNLTIAEWVGLLIFTLSCSMISIICEQVIRSRRRLSIQAEELRRSRDAAEAASRAKSMFLSNVSHELRNPLNVILGFSQLLARDPELHARQAEQLAIINRSGGHLLTLVDEVLDMAKIESGRMELNNSVFLLDHLIRDTANMLQVRAAEKGLGFEVRIAPDLPAAIEADASKLRQILLNLLGNAIKFTEHGKVMLEVSLKPTQEGAFPLLLLRVQDTGVGIAAEQQKLLFRPFVQLENSIFSKGTGLGLSITKQFVNLMGGTIQIESYPGYGSSFSVILPVKNADPEFAERLDVENPCRRMIKSSQRTWKIAIVEDQMENWVLVQEILNQAGFTTKVATSGEEGIDLFRVWQPDLILMDVRMPVMGGIVATQAIRKLSGGKDIPIVAVTASVYKEERQALLGNGFTDFLRKPYGEQALLDCIAQLLPIEMEELPIGCIDPPEPDIGLPDKRALLEVPLSQRQALSAALAEADRDKVLACIASIAKNHQELGGILLSHARKLRYTQLFDLLQGLPQ